MTVRLILGDVRAELARLAANSVDCVVCSPPYWGLRSYLDAGDPDKPLEIGLEPTLGEHLDTIVAVFRLVRRVLRPHGTVWLNYGDCYASAPNGKSAAAYKADGSDDRTFRDKPFSTVGPVRNGRTHYGGSDDGSRGVDRDFHDAHRPKAGPIRGGAHDGGEAWQRAFDGEDRAAVRAQAGPIFDLAGGASGGGVRGANKGNTRATPKGRVVAGGYLKAKDLCMIPNRLAIALQDDGWWVRSEIIWCLSGGTWLYARTAKGDMPVMVKDLARLKPGTVKLWNGEHWTRLLGMSKTARNADEIEIVLRSGERVSCTPTHKFPTGRGLIEAGNIVAGDVIASCRLPEPENPRVDVLDEDAAWLAGLYLAEGSMSGGCISIAGHARETERWENVRRIAQKFGASATMILSGNNMTIRIYGKVVRAILDEFVSGRVASNKCFSPVVWRRSDSFVRAMLEGYLAGDGHKDEKNERWRLGFTRNHSLERDLRTAAARLGAFLTLNLSTSRMGDKVFKTHRGELRFSTSGHHNVKDKGEVIEIRKARCRQVWDLGVEDEPHLFALASGILTHNSKPSPMPESVYDRPTNAHEKIWLLTKRQDYYYNHEAVREPVSGGAHRRAGKNSRENVDHVPRSRKPTRGRSTYGRHTLGEEIPEATRRPGVSPKSAPDGHGIRANELWHASTTDLVETRALRNVWTIPSRGYRGAHFATFPERIAERCILAGTPPTVCGFCGRVAGCEAPMCSAVPRVPGTVLDPFGGSGTVGAVADRLSRDAVLIDLKPEYLELARARIFGAPPPDIAEAAE